ncbi:MAG TPA: Fis family transcriptional regulator [Elusimicrobia bacterium]|nr:Fis family transcriptional regulator [Elusimicrobiota bacterium]
MGIFPETLARLRALHGPALEGVRIERAVVGIVFSGVKLSTGHGGMAGTPRPESLFPPRDKDAPPPGALKGRPVLSLLEPWPEDPFLAALAAASMSALSAPWLEKAAGRTVYDKDPLELLEVRPGMSVAVVGAFRSYIDRLKAVPGVQLKVLELRESALSEDHRPFFVPTERAGEVVPSSDLLVITGLSLVNGTLEDLLSLARKDAQVALVGPSGSILPDALFSRGVTLAGGCVLDDPDEALELLSQGGRAHHLYGRCARKINLLR